MKIRQAPGVLRLGRKAEKTVIIRTPLMMRTTSWDALTQGSRPQLQVIIVLRLWAMLA